MKRGANPVHTGNYGGRNECFCNGGTYGDEPTADAVELDLRRMRCNMELRRMFGLVELRQMEWPEKPANSLYTVIERTGQVALKCCTEYEKNLYTKDAQKNRSNSLVWVGWVFFFQKLLHENAED